MIIADTGTGIPAAERAHIFDRFRSGAEPGDGRRTGLGLALVRAVARAHGGEALVRSTPGQGSEFELVLPVTRRGGRPGSGGNAAHQQRGQIRGGPGRPRSSDSWRGGRYCASGAPPAPPAGPGADGAGGPMARQDTMTAVGPRGGRRTAGRRPGAWRSGCAASGRPADRPHRGRGWGSP